MEQSNKARAVELKAKGLTYAEVGRQLGISAQRVFQLVAPPREVRTFVKSRADSRCQDCGVEITNGHLHHVNSNGVEPDNFNDIENLRYLCASCHRRTHYGMTGPIFCGTCGNRLTGTRCLTCQPKNQFAADLAKSRWNRIPKEERSQLVPRNGGKPKQS